MGAGKSLIGATLARRWGLEFYDTDDGVSAAAGMSLPELFEAKGEPYFRQLERQVVAQALRQRTGVVALGGGATTRQATQEALALYRSGGGIIIYLDVSLPYAAERVGLGSGRPMIAGDARARWAELDYARRPVMQSICTFRILTDAISAQDAAIEIERRLSLARIPT
jgi:shikimate kinase